MGYEWDYLNKKTYDTTIGRYRSAIEHNFIVNGFQGKSEKLLDIAGGSGRIAIPLIDYSNNITVLDINKDALEILKKRKLGIDTICEDFTKFEFKDKFSHILCIEGPDYFHNWEEFFSKVSTLLEKDGNFIFTYTNPDSWRYILRRLKKLGSHNPYYVMKFKEMKKLLDKNNFEIERVEGFYWMPLSITSNSVLVHFFAYMEKKLKLNKWHSQSPWLLISAKKKLIQKDY